MVLVVNELRQTPVGEQGLEIVERKGLGHPDHICDAIMNEVSVSLSREYIKRYGSVLHHNIDKGLLAAGEVRRNFGGGEVKRPMLMVFGDRATYDVDGDAVPIDEIAVSTAKKWFKKNLRFVDPDRHVRYQVELARGSEALRDIFSRKGKFYGANDTSAAVGYAPFTPTETIVLDTERYINSPSFKKEFPETGEDVKIMGSREGGELNLTIALAFVDRLIENENQYFQRKSEVIEDVTRFVKSRVKFDGVNIDINTLDKKGRGMGGIYLTVLGTSADDGDGGQVGRGNRVNGVIPLNRPTCSEAAAGKNPVSHVGKIYNLLTYEIAQHVHQKVPGVKEVYVWLLSQIGRSIDDPKVAGIELILDKGVELKQVSKATSEIAKSDLNSINDFTKRLTEGKIPVC
ncbi:MAG: S-adenosylmethionine synthetase [Crenarchaeota archaeon 13_1_40CM_3_52_10]|nr:MAG: S-adenosylmethionine synthetase [Crenarchaeota archaeon 13_1_40CM_3_52_10]